MKKLTFEVICLSSSDKTTIKNEINLLYSLMSNGEMWKQPILKDSAIIDQHLNVLLSVKQQSHEDEVDINIRDTYLVRLKGNFDQLERIRIQLLKHLDSQGYDHIYILLDEVSSKIASIIYPKINTVENLLRKYLMKFFITKLGPSWWNVTADSEMKKKVNTRKNNEEHFSNYTDNKAFLIDFGELGKIVHSQSSGFISREDIVSKVLKLDETPDAIKTFKRELESNYTKFFKDTFKDKGFQPKWEELEKLRHKVAHNSLFTRGDLDKADELTNDLILIIDKANENIDSVKFSVNEKDLLKENISNNLSTYNVISEKTLLDKLIESEKWALKSRHNFVGLKHFATTHLGDQGFDFASTYDLINKLNKDRKIELYDYRGPNNSFPVKAIRSVQYFQEISQVDVIKS